MAKQKRNAQETKLKILTNAKLLFSKQGYDATTVDDIANASDVNKALIYYYFKNKSGLYSEVMSGLFDAIYEEVVNSSKKCNSVVDELEVFIYSYASYAYKHPYFPALLLRELSDSGAHLPEMMFVSMRRLFSLLSDILKRAEEQKVFKHSIAMVVHFMIIGGLNLMVTTKPLREKAMEVDKDIDTCADCLVDDVAEFIFETMKNSLEVR